MRFLLFHNLSFLIVLLLFNSNGLAQNKETILPKTLILKVKEAYRNICFKKVIDHTSFNKSVNELGLAGLTKIFPDKEAVYSKNSKDLSLIYLLNYTNSYTEDEAIRMLKKMNLFEYVESYDIPKLTYTPNDTLLAEQYHISLINAIGAWDINRGDTNIVIGITDTGWDPSHPDLVDNVKVNYSDPINGIDDDNDGFIDNNLGWDLGMNDNNALFESSSHGVHVTGIAAAVTDNITGVVGVGFNTKFLPIKISNAAGVLTHAYQGIVYAADHGCSIINCSWGSYQSGQFQKDVIDYALSKGCIVVAAVGNDNQEGTFYPAGYEGVVAVASTNQNDLKHSISNFGYYVDVSSPGESIWSTVGQGGYGLNSGTSMASPMIAGSIAIIKAQFPSYTNEQVIATLRASSDNINGINTAFIDKLGNGRVNLFNALSNTGLQFIEMTNYIITDGNNNVYQPADTLRLSGTFNNYLAPITGASVTLTSNSEFIEVLNAATNLPALNTLDIANNTDDPFLIRILSGVPVDEEVILQLTISNDTFTYNQYITFLLNPSSINLLVNQISTTITSNGRVGSNGKNIGLGFTYKGKQLLFEAGLMVGDGRVADVIRDGNKRDQDFLSINNINFQFPYKSNLDLRGVMDDSPHISPMDVIITHSYYAYANPPDDKYIIVTYDIENNGFVDLTDLYAGIFADWDITENNLNKADYDSGRKMGYVYSLDADGTYAAIKVLSNNTATNYAIDLNGGESSLTNGGFSTSEKYIALSASKNSAGGTNGSDVAHVVSTGKFNLNVRKRKRVAFAIIAGDNLSDVQASADAAQFRYVNDGLNISEQLKDNTYVVAPNPTKGIFYVNTEEEVKSITIKNVLGESIQEYSNSLIDISTYPNGIYFIEVNMEGKKLTEKLILAK